MEIATLVSNQNPQWADKNFLPEEDKWPRRALFQSIEKWLDKRFIIALTGVRRVGKSTLLKQTISQLLKSHLSQEILYFSFEKIQVKLEPSLLENIISYYLNTVLEKKSYQVKKTVYLFFDEIQNVPAWQEIIKSYYDQNENFKFIVSGSSSLFIKKRSLESLAGRIIDIKVNPLSFKEYLSLAHSDFIVKSDSKIWLGANLNLLNGYFEKYLKAGQFPEIITEKLSIEEAHQYLESIEEKITQTDLPKIFPIKHPEILTLILNQIKSSPGQRIEYDEFAQNAGLDQRTISKYFSYLQKGFLISLCQNFGKKPLKSLRVAKKAYLASSNLAQTTEISHQVENYIFNFFDSLGYSVFFQKDKEIDFIIQDKQKKILLAEVKYQNEIKSSDTKNLKDFLEKSPASAYLITKSLLKPGKHVNYIPASLIEFYL